MLCFMNDDVEVINPRWLEALVSRVGLEGVGAAGPLMYYHGRHDPARRRHFRARGCRRSRSSPSSAGCRWVLQSRGTGTGFVLRHRRMHGGPASSVFEQLGGFDERFDIAYNDVDFCIRLRKAGWRIIWTPVAELYHRESVSVGRPESPERVEKLTSELGLMRRLWSRELDQDPFYSPNLALESGRLFSPAFPPRQRPPWRSFTADDAVAADAAGSVSCLD